MELSMLPLLTSMRFSWHSSFPSGVRAAYPLLPMLRQTPKALDRNANAYDQGMKRGEARKGMDGSKRHQDNKNPNDNNPAYRLHCWRSVMIS
jgi:hypothetical protein